MGIGCRVRPDGTLRIVLSPNANAELLDAVAEGRAVAVTFSAAPDHRAFQVKASQAKVCVIHDDDRPEMDRQCALFRDGLVAIGFPFELAAGIVGYDTDNLAAIELKPERVFHANTWSWRRRGAGPLMKIPLEALRFSLEGVVASVLATCDREGTPNVSMISQVHYVDSEHVALSYQFFNKTRRNLMDTRVASVQILDPQTFAQHRLDLDYVETLTSGPVFESMKAKLAGIASHHGMENVFRLLGADIFRVASIEAVPGPQRLLPPAPRPLLAATRRTCAELDNCADLDELLDCVCSSLEAHFGITTYDGADGRGRSKQALHGGVQRLSAVRRWVRG